METVTIYGRTTCGFCVRAQHLCEDRELNYRYVDIEKEGLSKSDLSEITGQPVHTVPQILVGETLIGGYTEFARYMQQA